MARLLTLAGIYASYSEWIDIEIQVAKNEFQGPKPIFAVRPRGNLRFSGAVGDAADEIAN